ADKPGCSRRDTLNRSRARGDLLYVNTGGQVLGHGRGDYSTGRSGASSTTRPSPQPYFATDSADTPAASTGPADTSPTRARPAKRESPTRNRTAAVLIRFCSQFARVACSAMT